MLSLFRALTERLKALFVTDVALDFKAQLLSRAAERQAELLRQADRYAGEGLHGIAEHLRRQAGAIDLCRPLAGVLPAVAHLHVELSDGTATVPRLRLLSGEPPEPSPASPPSPRPRKKGAKP